MIAVSRGIPLLDRYILKQLLDFFLLGLVIFSLIAFFSDTFLDFIQDLQKFGISTMTALMLMGLQMPRTIALVMPASSFLAALMIYNTLNNQFEIIAMRMNGISLSRLMVPAVVLGLGASLLTYWLNDYAVPYCNAQFERIQKEILNRGTLPQGQESFIFKDYDDQHHLRQMIYIAGYEGNRLKDSTIIDLKRPGVMQVIQSGSGRWHPVAWEFYNANAYTIAKESELLVFNHLENFRIKNLVNRDDRKEEERLKRFYQKNPKYYIDSDTMSFAHLWQVIGNREAAGKRVSKGTYISLWEKITLPLSCFVIILTAVPLALAPPRRGGQRGFVFALGVLFLYYILRSLFVAMGRAELFTLGGVIPLPLSLMLAAWLPLLAMAGFAGYLLAKKSRQL